MRDNLIDIAATVLGRAPTSQELAAWEADAEQGQTRGELTASLLQQDDAQARFPAAETNTDYLTNAYQVLFGRDPDTEGLAYWEGQLDAGNVDLDTLVTVLIDGARAETGNPNDATLVNARSEAAIDYVAAVESGAVEYDAADAATIIADIERTDVADPDLEPGQSGDGDDETPPGDGDGDDETPPGDGDDDDETPPGDGDDDDETPPGDGDDDDETPPGDGDDETPPGGDTQTYTVAAAIAASALASPYIIEDSAASIAEALELGTDDGDDEDDEGQAATLQEILSGAESVTLDDEELALEDYQALTGAFVEFDNAVNFELGDTVLVGDLEAFDNLLNTEGGNLPEGASYRLTDDVNELNPEEVTPTQRDVIAGASNAEDYDGLFDDEGEGEPEEPDVEAFTVQEVQEQRDAETLPENYAIADSTDNLLDVVALLEDEDVDSDEYAAIQGLLAGAESVSLTDDDLTLEEYQTITAAFEAFDDDNEVAFELRDTVITGELDAFSDVELPEDALYNLDDLPETLAARDDLTEEQLTFINGAENASDYADLLEDESDGGEGGDEPEAPTDPEDGDESETPTAPEDGDEGDNDSTDPDNDDDTDEDGSDENAEDGTVEADYNSTVQAATLGVATIDLSGDFEADTEEAYDFALTFSAEGEDDFVLDFTVEADSNVEDISNAIQAAFENSSDTGWDNDIAAFLVESDGGTISFEANDSAGASVDSVDFEAQLVGVAQEPETGF